MLLFVLVLFCVLTPPPAFVCMMWSHGAGVWCLCHRLQQMVTASSSSALQRPPIAMAVPRGKPRPPKSQLLRPKVCTARQNLQESHCQLTPSSATLVCVSLSHCQMMTPLPLALWFHWPSLLPFPTCGTGLITIAVVTSTYQSTSHTRHPPPRSHTSICLCQGLRRLVLVSAHCGDTLLPWCGLCWPSSHEEPQGGCCVGLGRAPHRGRHRSCSHTSVRPPACRPSS